MLLQLVDAAGDVLDAVLQDLLSDIFLIEDDNFLDRAYAALQVLANGQDLADHNGRACDRYSENLFDVMATLKTTRPHSRIIVTGYGMDEVTIVKAIASG